MTSIEQECFDFCREYDKNRILLQLDFSQCYVYYLMDHSYMLEFIPGNDTSKRISCNHLGKIPLPDLSVDTFERLIFKIPYEEKDIWLTVSDLGIKTLQSRFRIPKYPSAVTALILSKNIEMLNISKLSVVCRMQDDNVYTADGFFSYKNFLIPWSSWQSVLTNIRPCKIISWQYTKAYGLNILVTTYEQGNLVFCPVYMLRLDGTGHVSEQAYVGICPKNHPEDICFLFSCDIRMSEDMNAIYTGIYEKLKSVSLLWINKIEKESCICFDKQMFLLNLENMLCHESLKQVFGKKTLNKLKQAVYTYVFYEYSLSGALMFFLHATRFCSMAEKMQLQHKGFDIFYPLLCKVFLN